MDGDDDDDDLIAPTDDREEDGTSERGGNTSNKPTEHDFNPDDEDIITEVDRKPDVISSKLKYFLILFHNLRCASTKIKSF